MSGIWNAPAAGSYSEHTFGGAYFEGGCHRYILPDVPLYRYEYGGYAAHREFSTLGEWDCSECSCGCSCSTCEYSGIAAAVIGSAAAVDSPDTMGDYYGTAVSGVFSRGIAAGHGAAAWGLISYGITVHEHSELAIGAEIGSYNYNCNPFGFTDEAGLYDWSLDPAYPHPQLPPWRNPCTSRERINYLCYIVGIPTNRFWIPKDPVKYPQRDDSISGLAEEGSPFYAPNAKLGAMDDPFSVPDWEWAGPPPFPVESWYSPEMSLVSDASKGLILAGAGRFPTGDALTVLRIQRSCTAIGGRWRNGIVFSNTEGNSVWDTLFKVTGNPTNTGGGIVPAGLSWSLRGLDFRDTIFKYGLMASLGFLVDQSGNVVANGLFTLPGNLGQNGLWLGTPFVPSETEVPEWTDCLPRISSSFDRTKVVFTFFYPLGGLRYFVIDNSSQSTYWTTSSPF